MSYQSYQEKNKAFFTNGYVRTVLLSAVYHLGFGVVSYFVYVLILSNVMKPMLLDGLFDAIRYLTGAMSVVLFVWTQCLVANAYNKNQTKKKRYLDLTAHGKASDPEVTAQLLKTALLESLATLLPVALFALPSALFYASYGYKFGASLFFEDWNIGYVGIYQLIGNAWLGYLAALAVCFGIAFAGRMLSHRTWEQNRV